MRPRGVPLVGAVIIDLAKGTIPKTKAAEARILQEMEHPAILLHEHVVNNLVEGDEKPSPELCWIFHTHRQQRVSAPTGYRKQLSNIEAACKHISRGWDDVRAPPGSDARFAWYRA